MDDEPPHTSTNVAHPHLRLRRDASSRYGVTSRRTAAELGVSPSTYHDWCRTEGVRQLHRGVVGLPDVEPGPEQRIAAALLAVGPHAAAGRDSAAYLHGLGTTAPRAVTVLVPATRRAPALQDVDVVRTRHLDAYERTTVRRLACTSLERTLIDLVAGTGSGRDGLALVLSSLQRELVTVARLRAAVAAVGRRGAAMGRLLDRLGDQPDSIFEHLVLTKLRSEGLAPVVGHDVVVGGRRLSIDLAFPPARVAIECDGFAFHRRAGDLARDHERQNALVRAGWRVHRISWHAWAKDPDAVVAQIRALLHA